MVALRASVVKVDLFLVCGVLYIAKIVIYPASSLRMVGIKYRFQSVVVIHKLRAHDAPFLTEFKRI